MEWLLGLLLKEVPSTAIAAANVKWSMPTPVSENKRTLHQSESWNREMSSWAWCWCKWCTCSACKQLESSICKTFSAKICKWPIRSLDSIWYMKWSIGHFGPRASVSYIWYTTERWRRLSGQNFLWIVSCMLFWVLENKIFIFNITMSLDHIIDLHIQDKSSDMSHSSVSCSLSFASTTHSYCK